MIDFRSLKVSKGLVMTLGQLGILRPTFVQQKTIQSVYDKKDMIVQSKTGSGKTLCFAIPIIDLIEPLKRVQALIVTPTRELAKQIGREFDKFTRDKRLGISILYGGEAVDKQLRKLGEADIVVGTPGRLNDLIDKRKLNLTYCNFLVIDEADQLMDMGFITDIDRIVKHLPAQRQTLMFSATINPKVERLIEAYLHKPKKVLLENKVTQRILEQSYYHVEHFEKIPLLVHLLNKIEGLTLVFCNTKQATKYLTVILKKNNLNADCINGDMDQKDRGEVLERYHSGDLAILVATDVAARGIHVEDIKTVINFDLARNVESYTHRIGRTARQEKKGQSISIICDKDYRKFKEINKHYDNKIQKINTPQLKEIKMPKKKVRGNPKDKYQKRL